MRTRRFIIACLVLACALRAESVTVTLLATTDLHGYIYPYDYYTGKPAERGLAKIATLIRQARSENPNTLLIDCGDTIQGSPLESVYQDSLRDGKARQDPMMLAMDELGYAAMVLGNHEFDFGLKNLESARADARFPWLSANVIPGPGAGLKRFDAYVVKTVGGVRVAIVGITTPSVCAVAAEAGDGALRCLAGVEAAEAAVREVRQRQRPDLVVVAIHAGLGHGGDNMVTAVAERVPGIDAIVYGHSHQQQAGLRVGSVLLVQPKNWGASLARLDFVLEKTAAGWKLTDKRSSLIPAGKQVAADPEVLSLAQPYHDSAERYLKTPLFESAADLSGALGRVRDNALVDAIHEVQLHYAQADVSFASMFDLGVRIRKGPVDGPRDRRALPLRKRVIRRRGRWTDGQGRSRELGALLLVLPGRALRAGPAHQPRRGWLLLRYGSGRDLRNRPDPARR